MKRVALVWLCLLSVAQISLAHSAAMADQPNASGSRSSTVEARAPLRSRKLVLVAATEPASSFAEASSDKEESPAAEASVGAEAATAAAVTKHKSFDRSMAGGGVIIGGLVTAMFTAVFCYIRVTRTRDDDAR